MNDDLSGLDLIELLDRLEPLPEPPVVSFWPQTEAWLWVGFVGLALAAWFVRFALIRRRANAYRRAALREIAVATKSSANLAEILRRTALVAYPRAEVAGLYGDDWLDFLDRTGGLDRTSHGSDFREGVGRAFADAPYTDTEQGAESKQLAALAARWVRRHRNHVEAET